DRPQADRLGPRRRRPQTLRQPTRRRQRHRRKRRRPTAAARRFPTSWVALSWPSPPLRSGVAGGARNDRSASSRKLDPLERMLAYIVRRLLLMIPTLFGIMVLNFAIIQAAPGGPVEQMIQKIKGTGVSATERVSGEGSENLSARSNQSASQTGSRVY